MQPPRTPFFGVGKCHQVPCAHRWASEALRDLLQVSVLLQQGRQEVDVVFKPCTMMAGYMPHCIRDPDGEVLCCLDDFSPAKALSLLAAGVPSRCSSWIFSYRTSSSLPKCFNQPNYSVQETEARNVFQLILLLKSQSEIRIKFLINSKQWPASFVFSESLLWQPACCHFWKRFCREAPGFNESQSLIAMEGPWGQGWVGF